MSEFDNVATDGKMLPINVTTLFDNRVFTTTPLSLLNQCSLKMEINFMFDEYTYKTEFQTTPNFIRKYWMIRML